MDDEIESYLLAKKVILQAYGRPVLAKTRIQRFEKADRNRRHSIFDNFEKTKHGLEL